MAHASGITELTDLDREILKRVQDNLPDTATPYADIAAAVGTTEDHVVDLLTRMVDTGEIRRFGATLKHQKVGYGANVMVAWFVAEEDVDRVGAIMAIATEGNGILRRWQGAGSPSRRQARCR